MTKLIANSAAWAVGTWEAGTRLKIRAVFLYRDLAISELRPGEVVEPVLIVAVGE